MAPLQWPSDALRPFPSSFTPLRDALSFPSTPRAVISTKRRRKKKKKSRGSGTQSPILLSLCLWPCNPSTLLQLTLQVRGSSPGRLGGSILQTTREGRNDPSLAVTGMFRWSVLQTTHMLRRRARPRRSCRSSNFTCLSGPGAAPSGPSV